MSSNPHKKAQYCTGDLFKVVNYGKYMSIDAYDPKLGVYQSQYPTIALDDERHNIIFDTAPEIIGQEFMVMLVAYDNDGHPVYSGTDKLGETRFGFYQDQMEMVSPNPNRTFFQ